MSAGLGQALIQLNMVSAASTDCASDQSSTTADEDECASKPTGEWQGSEVTEESVRSYTHECKILYMPGSIIRTIATKKCPGKGALLSLDGRSIRLVQHAVECCLEAVERIGAADLLTLAVRAENPETRRAVDAGSLTGGHVVLHFLRVLAAVQT